MEKHGLLGTFASHAFLNGLSTSHLMRLASGVEPFEFAPGEYLGREGESAHRFYLIQKGDVEIGSCAELGEFDPITTVGPGEVVGWSWLLPPYRWQFHCRAKTVVRGIRFDADWLRNECENDHELGYQLLKHLLAVLAGRLAASRTAKRVYHEQQVSV